MAWEVFCVQGCGRLKSRFFNHLEKEKIKTGIIDVRNVKELNVTDLAEGGLGRLTLYTEEAIKQLGEKIN